jgi:hypothetical protein
VHTIPLYHVDISKYGDRLKAFGAIDRLFMFFLCVSQAHFWRAAVVRQSGGAAGCSASHPKPADAEPPYRRNLESAGSLLITKLL